MREHYRQMKSFNFLLVLIAVLTPSVSLACIISYNPEHSTDKIVTFDVRLKSGEKCAVPGDGQDAVHFRSGEKTSLNRGRYDRLKHELSNGRNPRKARWQYVYAAPKGWSGSDTVGISYSSPSVENIFKISVSP